MDKKALRKANRGGLTLNQVAERFGDEAGAIASLESVRWPDGPYCPYCGSFNVQSGIRRKTTTHRCRDREGSPMFTLRTGTVMEGTKRKYRVWAIGMYLYTMNLKGGEQHGAASGAWGRSEGGVVHVGEVAEGP